MSHPELTLGLIPQPRTLVMSSSSHALVLRASPDKQVLVEFKGMNDRDQGMTLQTGHRLAPCWGCLGLLEIEREIFVLAVTYATTIGVLEPNRELIHRVISVEAFCLTSAVYDCLLVTHGSATTTPGTLSFDPDEPLPPDSAALNGIKKILSNGQFYFSATGAGLSSRTQSRLSTESPSKEDDGRFSWNTFMLLGLSKFREGLSDHSRLQLDQQGFLVSVIQGYVASYELKLPPAPVSRLEGLALDSIGQPIKLSISLFSRLGSRRAGTRFNTRGIDDDGNVANFVETETVISVGSSLFSFVQIRGSVPLFFEQSGSGVTNVIGGLSGQGHKINLTRSSIASQPAFKRHFEDLLRHYSSVQTLNLLSNSKEGELQLSQAYHEQLQAMGKDSAQMSHFDLHQRARITGLDGVRAQLMNDQSVGGKMSQFGFFLGWLGERKGKIDIVREQKGLFRTNCLDCLDRTNVVQDMLSRMAVESFLESTSPHLLSSDYLWNCHRTLWADNGDVLSKIYAGTGALNTSFTRGGRQTFSGMLSNASKSVGRMYNSNFVDKSKQANIDLLLGHLSQQKPVKVFDPINDTIQRLLRKRKSDYSTIIPITIWAGTYNLNGRPPPTSQDEDLLQWLWPVLDFEPEILVVAFQEIVKLSPQQIMITDPEKKRRWERVILASLDQRTDKKCDYVILRSEQLVGAALIVLVKSEMVSAIRSVEATTKKTGLKGIAGNKGAVGIRLDFYDTSFCFVTAHFAAGQANVDERNHDYETIANELEFLKGKTISSHENVIWAGDLNYRIGGLNNYAVRQAVTDEDLSPLLAADQLLACRASRSVFAQYLEGPITFPPTYKYDVGTDRYDTSEKQRIPAWTDRILYHGHDLDIIQYSRAELKASDHRPVFAILKSKVRKVDRLKKGAIEQEVANELEVVNVREDLLGPVRAETVSQDDQSEVEEWWRTNHNPNGSYEPTVEDLTGVSRHVMNPFDRDFNPRSQKKIGMPASESNLSLGVDRLKINRTERPTSSAPSSPPLKIGKGLPPAIPARPSSRSLSHTRKLSSNNTVTPLDRRQSSLSTKLVPPPPPRPALPKRISHQETDTGANGWGDVATRAAAMNRSSRAISASISGVQKPPIPPKPKPPKPPLKPKPTVIENPA